MNSFYNLYLNTAEPSVTRLNRFSPPLLKSEAPPLRHGGAALVAKDSRMDGTRRSYFWLSAACAAARRAMGTRKGEQLT